jgi:predicted transcriptional regulator
MASEDSIFIKTFGDYPTLRIIDFLIESDMFDYPITEIAKNSNVHFQTFQKIWPRLVKNNFVVKTRKLGNSELYKINKENPVVQKLVELDKFLCKQYASRAIKKKVLIKARNN